MSQQKCTAIANEDSYIMILNKERTMSLLEKGLAKNFERVLEYLQTLEIFKDQDLPILLPIANCVVQKKYGIGEYIIKEGDVPRGLYMIVRGQCIVGSQKINIRMNQTYEECHQLKKGFTLKGNFKDTAIRQE